MRMHCPHYMTIARLHSLYAADTLWREYVYRCRNLYCGHTFITRSEVVRTLTHSKIPNPNVHIPISTRAAKRLENKKSAKQPQPLCAYLSPERFNQSLQPPQKKIRLAGLDSMPTFHEKPPLLTAENCYLRLN